MSLSWIVGRKTEIKHKRSRMERSISIQVEGVALLPIRRQIYET